MSLSTLSNPFTFIETDVRTATDDNSNVWFCAKDVCQVLDITWKGTSGSLENMPENWFMVLKLQTIKGERDSVFINESGLYHLIFRSNKPQAKTFANWVLETVLPEIRRHGFFGELDIKSELALDKRIDELSRQLAETNNAYRFQLLHDRLRKLCNLAGQTLPAIKLIKQEVSQLTLPGFDKETGELS